MNASASGVTRIETVALILSVGIVGAAITAMAATGSGANRRAACQNNLRQIGIGVRSWGNDHGDLAPWVITTAQGGTSMAPIWAPAAAWRNFLILSNHIATPRLLACPEDRTVRVAENWTSGPRGFANSGMRGNALSYLLALHTVPDLPAVIIAGDRDLKPSDPNPTVCGLVTASNVFAVRATGPDVVFTNSLHLRGGHLLRMDGAVGFHSGRVNEVIADLSSDSVNVHYAPAR